MSRSFYHIICLAGILLTVGCEKDKTRDRQEPNRSHSAPSNGTPNLNDTREIQIQLTHQKQQVSGLHELVIRLSDQPMNLSGSESSGLSARILQGLPQPKLNDLLSQLKKLEELAKRNKTDNGDLATIQGLRVKARADRTDLDAALIRIDAGLSEILDQAKKMIDILDQARQIADRMRQMISDMTHGTTPSSPADIDPVANPNSPGGRRNIFGNLRCGYIEENESIRCEDYDKLESCLGRHLDCPTPQRPVKVMCGNPDTRSPALELFRVSVCGSLGHLPPSTSPRTGCNGGQSDREVGFWLCYHDDFNQELTNPMSESNNSVEPELTDPVIVSEPVSPQSSSPQSSTIEDGADPQPLSTPESL